MGGEHFVVGAGYTKIPISRKSHIAAYCTPICRILVCNMYQEDTEVTKTRRWAESRILHTKSPATELVGWTVVGWARVECP